MTRPKAAVGFVTVAMWAGMGWSQGLSQSGAGAQVQGGFQPFPGNQPSSSAQPYPTAQPAEETAPLSPQQLDNLVGPIALYPDQLLSQVLAASTYPLEIVDAEQWLQQHKGMPAAQLLEAAKSENWDPSIQALVAFPDVLDILGHDIKWTTDLGNAFLAQQADVMAGVQRMRARAQQSGQLQTTPQQAVTTQYQDGQSAIEIAPTNPQVVYVPEYQPQAVWGAPAYGAYPSLWYPPAWGVYGGYGYGGYGYGGGIGFSPGVFLSSLFSGLLNYGPWGWGLNWFSHGLFLIPSFFAHFFGGWWGGHSYGYGYHGGAVLAGHPFWVHDPVHRMGVPYMNRAVATRFGGSFGVRGGAVAGIREGFGNRGFSGSAGRADAPRAPVGGARRGVGNGATRGNAFAGGNRTAERAPAYGGQSNRGVGGQSFAARPQAVRPQAQRQEAQRQPQMMARNFAAPGGSARQSFSAPSSRGSGGGQHFSAPSQHFSAPSQHFSAPKNSGGGGGSHFGGGGHSNGGGGHSSGGGHSGGGGGHSGGGHSSKH